MTLIDILRSTKFGRIFENWLLPKDYSPKKTTVLLFSRYLQRSVTVDIYLPAGYEKLSFARFPVLLFNDGQDMKAMQLTATLTELSKARTIPAVVIAAIHAGDRMLEYGTAKTADYKDRGKRAALYSKFIIKELLPHLQHIYRCSKNAKLCAIAGCSLGGLSALDIAWHHPENFQTVGVFSGSLWWRERAFRHDDPDADRIMHRLISDGNFQKGMRFWFQTGTEDETADRNKNGVIDAIDDTLDLIESLEKHGYRPPHDIRYREIEKGRHDTATWAEALPDFLCFAFSRGTGKSEAC